MFWVSFISRLLFVGGPAAIAGFVVAVIVYAFDAVLRGWARTHVGEEGREVIPAFTYGNSAFSIMCVLFGARIVASRFHASPNSVFASTRLAMGELSFAGNFAAVGEHPFAGNFATQASAGFRVTAEERIPSNYRGFTAIAPAQPAQMSRL